MWKDYEEAVFREFKRVLHFKNVVIKKNIYVVGKDSGVKRQIDVCLEYMKDGQLDLTTVVECKYYSTKVNVKVVDSFIGFLEDIGADNGIIVTEKGFSKAAIERAHKGKNDIEVDILNMGELSQFQREAAFPYSGDYCLALSTPFGWIIDGMMRGFAPAIMYRRGISFEEATGKEKEWLYLQFWPKESEVATLDSLIEAQNKSLKDKDDRAEIQMTEVNGLPVRIAVLPSYPTPEVTVYREFDSFISFVVLFCPELFVDRDTKKVASMLKEAIPIHLKQER